MPTLSELEDKWARNASANAEKWGSNTAATPVSDYADGLAEISGMPSAAVIAGSIPAVNWGTFASRAPTKVGDFSSGVDRAARRRKWSANFAAAFGARAPAPRRRARSHEEGY